MQGDSSASVTPTHSRPSPSHSGPRSAADAQAETEVPVLRSHTWKTCLQWAAGAAAAPASHAKFTASPESSRGLPGLDPHAPLRNATCDSLIHSCVHRRGARHCSKSGIWSNPTWGSQMHKPTKHQGCLALTRNFINAGRYCGKQLSGLERKRKSNNSTFSCISFCFFPGLTHIRYIDLINTWRNQFLA